MRHLLTMALALWIIGTGVACGPEQPREERAAPPAASNEPAGKLTVALSSLGTAQVYLPWKEAGAEGWIVMWGFYEGLAAVSPETHQLVPMLAERWEMLDNGGQWRFFLRRGVPFHDGRGELTAEDVKFTFDRILGQDSVHTGKGTIGAYFDHVEVEEPYQLSIYLKRPDPLFLDRITQNNFVGIVSKRYVEEIGEEQAAAQPIGTGPFRLVAHQRLHSATLEAVPNHWRQTARVKTLELRQVPDPSVRLDMLRANQAETVELPFKLKREAEASGFSFVKSEGAAIYHMHLGGQVQPSRSTWDPTVPWAADPADPAASERARKVRQALALAIDTQAIISSVFFGEAQPLASPYLNPAAPYLPKLTPYPYDPARAKQLLTEAGYPNGFAREIEMLMQPWPGRAEMVDVDEAVAGFWEKNLGLRVKRTPMDFATWAPIGRARDMAWRVWAQGVAPQPTNEPAIALSTWLTSTSNYNTIAETPELDELHARIVVSTDSGRRQALYGELAQKLYDGYYGIPIAAVPSLYAINPKRVAAWPRAPGESYLRGYEFVQVKN